VTSPPAVTALIPTFNAADMLADAVNSVSRQLDPQDRILIVDDGSIDTSLEVAHSLAHRDARIAVVAHTSNQGLAAARNTGIRLSSTDLIAFQDADDLSLEGRILTQRNFLRDNPQIDAVGSGWRYLPGLRNRTKEKLPPASHEDIVSGLLCSRTSLHGPTVMVRRRVFDHITEPFRGVLPAPEQDLWLRMTEHGYRFANIRQPLYGYRVHGGQMSSRHAETEYWSVILSIAAHQERTRGNGDFLHGWKGFPNTQDLVGRMTPDRKLELWLRLELLAQDRGYSSLAEFSREFLASQDIKELIDSSGIYCSNIRPALKYLRRSNPRTGWSLGKAIFRYLTHA